MSLRDRLTRHQVPQPPSPEPARDSSPARLPDDLTDAELAAVVLALTEQGWGRGGARGCMVTPEAVTAAVAQARQQQP